ncbi:A1pp-domain-containing protein [Lactarius sanguifluus]|nr:A1pp-domain-containing protein [Lactarius sanguifluus]
MARARVVSLHQIPTLRELYKRAAIAESPSEGREVHFPFSSMLLDRVSIYRGDITHVQVDAIVNAANNGLLGGGGVDGAIHRAAGPKLLKECRTLGGCPTGEARITAGYNLPAKHVIHAVGPVYHPKSKRAPLQLAGCYRISLELALQHGLKHIAFPAISTGIYSYPIEGAARVALGEIRKFLDTDEAKEFERVIFVVFSEEDEAVYLGLIPEYFPWDPPAASETSHSHPAATVT